MDKFLDDIDLSFYKNTRFKVDKYHSHFLTNIGDVIKILYKDKNKITHMVCTKYVEPKFFLELPNIKFLFYQYNGSLNQYILPEKLETLMILHNALPNKVSNLPNIKNLLIYCQSYAELFICSISTKLFFDNLPITLENIVFLAENNYSFSKEEINIITINLKESLEKVKIPFGCEIFVVLEKTNNIYKIFI